MVSARYAVLVALVTVLVAAASATYVATPPPTPKKTVKPSAKPTPAKKEKCYARGERAIGAPGFPRIEYYPCCDRSEPRPKKKDIYYVASRDWGLFCGGTGNFEVSKKNCHELGVKAIGAPGKPYVLYKPCCSGVSPREKVPSEWKTEDDKWGKFCLKGSSPSKGPAPIEPVVGSGKIRCAGAPGYPYVEYVYCGPDKKCAKSPKDGWGSFCLPKTAADCVKAGDRNEGAAGYPNVPYLPCCSGKDNVPVENQWGRFCPADGKPKTVIIVTNPPTVVKPRPSKKRDVPKGKPPPSPEPPSPMPSPDDQVYAPYVPYKPYY